MTALRAQAPANILARSYQAIFNKLMSLPANSASYWYWSKVYFAIRKLHNPLVEYSIDGCEILFPSSHASPFTWKRDPQNSKSLGRVAAACTDKFPDSVILDIGANIGDSAAIIRAHKVKNKIISVEGVKYFFDILSKNADRIGNVVPVHRFVSTASHDASVELVVLDSGNAAVFENPEYFKKSHEHLMQQANVAFDTIDDIVQKHAHGSSIKLIKTDIEGYDLPVLNSSLDFIAMHNPLIYLELHVSDAHEKSKNVTWKDLWDNLKALGYSKALYWYCSSDFLCMLDMHADGLITEDIHDYFRNRGGSLYCDVCLIHKDDGDLAAAIHRTERAIARQDRMNIGY